MKTATLVLLCLPGAWLAGEYFTGELGSRPVLAVVHGTGLWTIRLVLVTLVLTPARVVLLWPQSTVLRRMIGVAAACYAVLHVGLYSAQQNFRMLHVATEIVRRFYLGIGFVAVCGLVALAATSFDGTMRRMGRNWKRLHRLIYLIAGLGVLHFALQAKSDVSQAMVAAGLLVWLLSWRVLPPHVRQNPWTLLVLVLVAPLATAGIETAWYALATGVNWHRVLMANLQLRRPRPSAVVACWAIGAVLLTWVRHLMRHRADRLAGEPASSAT